MKSRLMIVSEPYLACVEELPHLNSNDLLLMADDGQISIAATKQLLTLQRDLSLSVDISSLKGESESTRVKSLAYQMGHMSETYDQFTLIMDLPNYEISAIASQFDCQADLYITPDPHAVIEASTIAEKQPMIEEAIQAASQPAELAVAIQAETLVDNSVVEITSKETETVEPIATQTAEVVSLAEQPMRKAKKDNDAVINAVMQKFASSRQYDPLQTSKPTAGIAVEGAME